MAGTLTTRTPARDTTEKVYCPLCTTLVTATCDVDDDDGRATTDDDDNDDNDENSYGGNGVDLLCYIDTIQARPALLSELVTRIGSKWRTCD